MPSPAHELDAARLTYWEDAGRSLAIAVDVHERARVAGDGPLRARALALQGACSLHRGDLHGALALAAEGDLLAGDCLSARVELAALKSHLNFFSGAYAAALAEAELAVELADRTGDLLLRVFARRMACVVFGNMAVASWPERLEALLEMTIEAGEPWEEAMSRNDLAHLRMEQGDLAEAEAELAPRRVDRPRAGAAQPLRARGHPLHARGGAAARRPPRGRAVATPTARSAC